MSQRVGRSRVAGLGWLALLLLAVLLPAGSAAAHDPATVTIVAPAEGAEIRGNRLRVTLTAAGGTSSAAFRLRLDGEVVDTNGRLRADSPFTVHQLRAGDRRTLTIRLPREGEHELRLAYEADVDVQRPDIVRRFRSVPGGGGLPLAPIAGGVVAVTALGLVVATRRRARATADRAARRRAARTSH